MDRERGAGLFGTIAGNTAIGIAICIAAGAVAAYVWDRMERRDSTR